MNSTSKEKRTKKALKKEKKKINKCWTCTADQPLLFNPAAPLPFTAVNS